MFRSTDVRNTNAELELVRSILARGERLLCHGELIVGEVRAPKGSLSATASAMAAVGALVVTAVDDEQLRLRWDDVYTRHPSENLSSLIDGEEAELRANITPSAPLEVTEFFARLGWLSDIVDGRKLLVDEATITEVDWDGAETEPIDDPATPSADLVGGIEHWLLDTGFTDNEFPTNYIRSITDDVSLCVGVAPQAFKLENQSRRHPVVANIGIAHAPINEFSDWIGSRSHRPSRWTLHEPVHYFNANAQVAWHPETDLEQAIAEIEPALDIASRLAEPDALTQYFARHDAVVNALHQRNRVAFHLAYGWNDRGEQELATWKESATSATRFASAEATVRKYLETNEVPYYFQTKP